MKYPLMAFSVCLTAWALLAGEDPKSNSPEAKPPTPKETPKAAENKESALWDLAIDGFYRDGICTIRAGDGVPFDVKLDDGHDVYRVKGVMKSIKANQVMVEMTLFHKMGGATQGGIHKILLELDGEEVTLAGGKFKSEGITVSKETGTVTVDKTESSFEIKASVSTAKQDDDETKIAIKRDFKGKTATPPAEPAPK